MPRIARLLLVAGVTAALLQPVPAAGQDLDDLKDEVVGMVEENAKMVQEIIDMLYSFGELGM
ncbi:MAG: amidohydrolase, partial [Gemmatimonadota bacterium]|nr:amidohydrolase [Gemmatimonadota bacterium]